MCDVDFMNRVIAFAFRDSDARFLEMRTVRDRSDPPRLASWKSLHRNLPTSDVHCRTASTAHGSKPGGSSNTYFPRGISMFVLTCSARIAARRLGEELRAKQSKTPFIVHRQTRTTLSSPSHPDFRLRLDMKCNAKTAHRFASANLALRANA